MICNHGRIADFISALLIGANYPWFNQGQELEGQELAIWQKCWEYGIIN